MEDFSSPSRKTDASTETTTLGFISIGSQSKILSTTVQSCTERRYTATATAVDSWAAKISPRNSSSSSHKVHPGGSWYFRGLDQNHSCIQAQQSQRIMRKTKRSLLWSKTDFHGWICQWMWSHAPSCYTQIMRILGTSETMRTQASPYICYAWGAKTHRGGRWKAALQHMMPCPRIGRHCSDASLSFTLLLSPVQQIHVVPC